MHAYPHHLQSLIAAFKKLPGAGSKSAERYAFGMIEWDKEQLHHFAELLASIPEKIRFCEECGCLAKENGCPFCTEVRKASKVLCVIATPKEAYAIESTHSFSGTYHVLGGLISPLDGIGPEQIPFEKLFQRIENLGVEELILALDSSVEGDATALYLKKELSPLPLSISRLAFGLPMGSSLDYVDGGTLAKALQGRNKF